MSASRTPPTTPAEEPPVSWSSCTEGEAAGFSETEFGTREDLGWGSGSLLEVVSFLVVVVVDVVVVVVVGNFSVVDFVLGVVLGVVEGVGGGVVVGFCTVTSI